MVAVVILFVIVLVPIVVGFRLIASNDVRTACGVLLMLLGVFGVHWLLENFQP